MSTAFARFFSSLGFVRCVRVERVVLVVVFVGVVSFVGGCGGDVEPVFVTVGVDVVGEFVVLRTRTTRLGMLGVFSSLALLSRVSSSLKMWSSDVSALRMPCKLTLSASGVAIRSAEATLCSTPWVRYTLAIFWTQLG